MLRNQPKQHNKWLKIALLILVWIVIWSLSKDLSKVRRGFGRIEEARDRLYDAQEKNNDLKQKMASVETDYFKEKVIRDKLNMQLPGEVVVVLPGEIVPKSDSEEGVIETEKSNWEMWWEVFR